MTNLSISQLQLTKKTAIIAIILAACFWGGLVIFVRAFGQIGFSSMEIVALRIVGTFFWLFPFSLLLKFKYNSALTFDLKLKDIWCFIGSGFLSIIFFSYCYFQNVKISSAAFAAVLMYTSPIVVMLLSFLFFQEKINKRKFLALFLAVGGAFLMCRINNVLFGSEKMPLYGLFLGIGSSVGYALYSIFSRFALKKGYSPLFITLYTFLFASIGIAFLVDLKLLFIKLYTLNLFPLWLAMGLLGSTLPFALYTIALKRISTSDAAILATLEPLVTTIFGITIYGETLSFSEILGTILVLSAAVLVSLE